MSNVPLRVRLHGIRSSPGPSGPRTTEPEFYATPGNKVAKLPKAVMPQTRGDGAKVEGQQMFSEKGWRLVSVGKTSPTLGDAAWAMCGAGRLGWIGPS